jgi:hypothetical protein
VSRSRGYAGLAIGAIVALLAIGRFALRLHRVERQLPEPAPQQLPLSRLGETVERLSRDAGVAPDPSIHRVYAPEERWAADRRDFGREVALSDDGLVLATSGAGLVDVYERSAMGGELEAHAHFDASVFNLAITPDGTRLAAIGDREILVFRRGEAGWSEEARIAIEDLRSFTQPAISADGRVLLADAHVLVRSGRRWSARARDVMNERVQGRLLVISDDGRTGAECTSARWGGRSGHVAVFPVRGAARGAHAPLPGSCLGLVLSRDGSAVTVLHQPFSARVGDPREPLELLTYRVFRSHLLAPVRRAVPLDPRAIWIMKAADESTLLVVSLTRACVIDASAAEPAMVRCDDIDSPVPESGAIAPNGRAWAVRSARGQVSVIDGVR